MRDTVVVVVELGHVSAWSTRLFVCIAVGALWAIADAMQRIARKGERK